MRTHLLTTVVLLAFVATAFADFPVIIGSSWDGTPLQQVLDDEYGVGVINAATDYEGYLVGDADPPYWTDQSIDGLIIREIAGYQNTNTMGWYAETLLGPPVIDGVGDGVIFSGPMSEGASNVVVFPGGTTNFGFYLNPNGSEGSGANAPEPELFFTNRSYNDLGPWGSGALHAPFDGDPQALVYNITHLRDGVPTFVIAWEDLDSGAELTPAYSWTTTDNDFQDLVVEITAISTVKTEDSSIGRLKALYRQ